MKKKILGLICCIGMLSSCTVGSKYNVKFEVVGDTAKYSKTVVVNERSWYAGEDSEITIETAHYNLDGHLLINHYKLVVKSYQNGGTQEIYSSDQPIILIDKEYIGEE